MARMPAIYDTVSVDKIDFVLAYETFLREWKKRAMPFAKISPAKLIGFRFFITSSCLRQLWYLDEIPIRMGGFEVSQLREKCEGLGILAASVYEGFPTKRFLGMYSIDDLGAVIDDKMTVNAAKLMVNLFLQELRRLVCLCTQLSEAISNNLVFFPNKEVFLTNFIVTKYYQPKDCAMFVVR